MCSVSGARAGTPGVTFHHLLGKIQGWMDERNHQPWDGQDGMQRYDDNGLFNTLPLSCSSPRQRQLLRGGRRGRTQSFRLHSKRKWRVPLLRPAPGKYPCSGRMLSVLLNPFEAGGTEKKCLKLSTL